MKRVFPMKAGGLHPSHFDYTASCQMPANTGALRRFSELLYSPRSRALVFGVLLALVTIVAYRHAWNGGVFLGDGEYVVKKALVVAPHGFNPIWISLDSPSP